MVGERLSAQLQREVFQKWQRNSDNKERSTSSQTHERDQLLLVMQGLLDCRYILTLSPASDVGSALL